LIFVNSFWDSSHGTSLLHFN